MSKFVVGIRNEPKAAPPILPLARVVAVTAEALLVRLPLPP